jgi:uncharacterized membrane protein (DUF106 family)
MISITPAGETIALVSIGLSIMSALVRRAVLDMDKMNEMKQQMKKHQETLKQATKSGEKKKAQKAQEELMKLTMENMKHSFKPMIITFIPFILIFYWLRDQYGNVGEVANLFGFGLTWFWWYLVCAMIFSIILNKVFKVT